MKLYYWSIIVILYTVSSFLSCSKDVDSDYAYIGGEIINANTNYVVLSKSDVIIDTVKLDVNNRFLYKINNLEPGLYTFRHGIEVQMMFLEPRDSVLFRLNTLDFDESLVYTGEGSKKNNYLIDEFLQNEIEEKEIFSYCQSEPLSFEAKLDSLKSNKLKKLKAFSNRYKTSELFEAVAKANIDFSYYSSKEIYPFIHYGKNKQKIIKSLPKDFYSYRKDIDYNSDFHKDYFNYNSFLRSNFKNLALNEHFEHSKDSQFNRKSLCYNLDVLKLVDSLVDNKSIKNNLLYNYTITFLAKSNSSENNNAILKSFLSKSTNEENKSMIANLTHSLNGLKPGGSFPDIDVLDSRKVAHNINTLVNKPTAIYFWSHSFYEHFKESHYKIKELKTKYPEVDFIAINIDDHSSETWMRFLKENKFSFQNEYQFKDPEKSINKLAIHPMTKVIILDKDHTIINNNTNIFAINFEEQLLGLINK